MPPAFLCPLKRMHATVEMMFCNCFCSKLDSCRKVSEDLISTFTEYQQDCQSCILVTSAKRRVLCQPAEQNTSNWSQDGLITITHTAFWGQIHPLCNSIKLYKMFIFNVISEQTAPTSLGKI